jgi:pyruvate formate lyase activating enzyme
MTATNASLRVGGVTPLTTIDYPGELAAVVFCQGCPWRCTYCQNAHLQPAEGDDQVPWSDVLGFLGRRRSLLDAVVFSGGEPTLQSALPAALSEVRALGFKTGLHTAGPYPMRLARVLPLLDWIGLDIKALPEDYDRVTATPRSADAAWRSLTLLLESGLPYEVRVTVDDGHLPAGRLDALLDRLRAHGVEHVALQPCRDPAGGACSTGDLRQVARRHADFREIVVRTG